VVQPATLGIARDPWRPVFVLGSGRGIPPPRPDRIFSPTGPGQSQLLGRLYLADDAPRRVVQAEGNPLLRRGAFSSIIGQIWMRLSPGVPHLRVPRHLVVKGTEPFPRRVVYGVLQCRAARPYSPKCVEERFSEVPIPALCVAPSLCGGNSYVEIEGS
jgi:hypothetical protein